MTPTGPKAGTLTLRAMLYNRGYGSVEYRNAEDVLTIAFTDERAAAGAEAAGGSSRDRRA